AYLLLGETSIGHDRVRRLHEAEGRLAAHSGAGTEPGDPVAASVSDLCRSINGFGPTRGNRVVLLGDPAASPAEPTLDCDRAIKGLIEAIEAATQHIHVSFYIWLDDDNGGRVADAISAAARRGVTCRIMADALGSRDFVRGPRWRQLREAGAQLVVALRDIPRMGNATVGRVDLRNHRKLVVIDNRVAFCGSQNCADPQFRVKAKYAPWIDVLLRCEGPVVRQAQHLFLSNWIAEAGETGEDLYVLPAAAPEPELYDDGVVAQMFGTGPTTPGNTMSDAFVSVLYAAERELIITTPYFVPDQALLRAVCAAPRRGVETTLVVPAHNDSALVAAACRSAYPDLLRSGVRLFEYPLGLLHTKSITVDARITLVGSANMDRRSLELNFENNLLVLDPGVTKTIRDRQLGYLSESTAIEAKTVDNWPFRARLVDNAIGMASPLL
ncbi:MAG: cardiolipin synthase, partial [Trebonia sp.]